MCLRTAFKVHLRFTNPSQCYIILSEARGLSQGNPLGAPRPSLSLSYVFAEVGGSHRLDHAHFRELRTRGIPFIFTDVMIFRPAGRRGLAPGLSTCMSSAVHACQQLNFVSPTFNVPTSTATMPRTAGFFFMFLVFCLGGELGEDTRASC